MAIWAIWFGGVLAAFAAIEIAAKWIDKPAALPTLSRAVWQLQARFPIFAVAFGLVAGGLIVHFFGAIPACR